MFQKQQVKTNMIIGQPEYKTFDLSNINYKSFEQTVGANKIGKSIRSCILSRNLGYNFEEKNYIPLTVKTPVLTCPMGISMHPDYGNSVLLSANEEDIAGQKSYEFFDFLERLAENDKSILFTMPDLSPNMHLAINELWDATPATSFFPDAYICRNSPFMNTTLPTIRAKIVENTVLTIRGKPVELTEISDPCKVTADLNFRWLWLSPDKVPGRLSFSSRVDVIALNIVDEEGGQAPVNGTISIFEEGQSSNDQPSFERPEFHEYDGTETNDCPSAQPVNMFDFIDEIQQEKESVCNQESPTNRCPEEPCRSDCPWVIIGSSNYKDLPTTTENNSPTSPIPPSPEYQWVSDEETQTDNNTKKLKRTIEKNDSIVVVPLSKRRRRKTRKNNKSLQV